MKMNTIKLTMSQALLKFLDNQYISIDAQESKFVEGVIGIFGHGNVTGIGEALEYFPTDMTYIQGNNEQGMVHTATAFAKQKNRLGIYACTTSIGPGALNMVTGAGTATTNRIPVLLLPGDIFACRQPDPVLQQLENPQNYSDSVNDCFKPVSKFWDRINRPEQLISSMINAMRVLTDPVDTGAVTICLPQDVQSEAYDYPESFFKKRVHYIDRKQMVARELQLALDKISAAKRPLIISGGGVHYSLATDTLSNFSSAFNIPVSETQAGKSSLPFSHPLNVGGLGVTGTLPANVLAKKADLLIAIGTRLQDFTTSSKKGFNPDAEIIHLNVSSFDALKMDGFSLIADAKAGLEQITEGLKNKSYVTEEVYQDEIKILQNEWKAELDKIWNVYPEKGMAQSTVLGIINEFVGPDDTIICAAGSLPGDLHRIWQSKAPKDYHLEYAFSCMGYEVSGGLGVKLAKKNGEVYVLVGDGSFLMLHSELLTSLQEHQKINIILFDNSGYQCIKNLQESAGSEGFGNEFRYRGNDNRLSGDKVQIDFTGFAKSLGAEGLFVADLDSLKTALEKAKTYNKSTLIEIKVNPRTMTSGYETWWRYGVAEVSTNENVQKAYQDMEENIAFARPY